MFDDAWLGADERGHGSGVDQPGEVAVEDDVALVGDERPPVALPLDDARPQRGQIVGHGAAGKGDDLHGHGRARAQPVDALALVGDDDQPARGRGDDLLPQQRPAQPLDQVQPRVDLVRAVNGDIDRRVVVEAAQGHAAALGFAGGHLGRGDADDALELPRGQQRAEATHGKDGRAARAQADDHARLDIGDGPFGRFPLECVAVTHRTPAQSSPATPATPRPRPTPGRCSREGRRGRHPRRSH